jgi:hypothetical protein
MRCDEIQEHFAEILYDEPGGSAGSDELRAHLRACPECRRQLEELEQTRHYLRRWKDESPLRSVAVARREKPETQGFNGGYLRYAALAAMALITLLALVNSRIVWNKDGFSFSTGLFAGREAERDYYSKDEIRELLQGALDDSESRMSEVNYMMVQRMLDTLEQERWTDLRLDRRPDLQNRNKN